jgi:hypothetical protein
MTQKIFVAYSYQLYPGEEYRACFSRAGKVWGLEFQYADSRISNEQILDKIEQMIRESTFSIFDISDWNPNVTLELGLARGIGHPTFIAINPSKSTGGIKEAPADLRGFDRVQYDSLSTLEARLSHLFEQQFGRGGSFSHSLGDVIRDHVNASLDQFIRLRKSAPDRDTTVTILPGGPILPLETEVVIRELPSNQFRFPPDPFRPSAPVDPWVTAVTGNVARAAIAVGLAIEVIAIGVASGARLLAAGALLVTLPTAGWFFSARRKRRSFENANPYSVTYRRPPARSVGPYFVWTLGEPADPDDPHERAQEGDPRAVGVEIKWRAGRPPPKPASNGS